MLALPKVCLSHLLQEKCLVSEWSHVENPLGWKHLAYRKDTVVCGLRIGRMYCGLPPGFSHFLA